MRFIILIVVIVVVVAAGLVTLKFASDTGQQPVATAAPAGSSQVETVDILVARSDIPVGTVLNDSMIDRQPWPKHLVLSGFIVGGAPDSNLTGMVARSDFRAHEPFIATRLAKPNDASFLAAGLDKDMRAVTVAVDAISGVAGYIFPGDRVDVLFTHRVPQDAPSQMEGAGQQSGPFPMPMSIVSKGPTTSEVLLPNIRVLAVNTRPAHPEGQQQAQVSDAPSNITLAMTQDETKRLRLAEKNGTVSLTLRSVKDEGDAGVGTPVTLMDISRVEDAGPGSAKWRQRRAGPGGTAPMPASLPAMPDDKVVIIRGVTSEKPALSGGGLGGLMGMLGQQPMPPMQTGETN